VWDAVAHAGGLTPDALAALVAARLRLDVADLAAAHPRARRLVPEALARRHQVFPLAEDHQQIVLATSDPNDLGAEQELGFATSRRPVFRVAAPRSLAAAIAAGYRGEAAPAPLVQVGGTGARILLVEDDEVERALARAVLERAGYAITEAADGRAALARLEHDAMALVLTDLRMPHLDGRTLLERLRAAPRTASLPVVVLTSSADPVEEAALIDAGADDYLHKPFDPVLLQARVRAVLRRRAG
jgi:CheY-like chemotaxis protein